MSDKKHIGFEVPAELADAIEATAELRGYDNNLSEFLRNLVKQEVSAETLEDQIERLEEKIDSLEAEKEKIENDIDVQKSLLEHKRSQLEEKRDEEEVEESELEEAWNTVAAYTATEVDVTVAAESSVETILTHDDSVDAVDDLLKRAEERVEEIDPTEYLPDRMVASNSAESSAAELL